MSLVSSSFSPPVLGLMALSLCTVGKRYSTELRPSPAHARSLVSKTFLYLFLRSSMRFKIMFIIHLSGIYLEIFTIHVLLNVN